MDRTQGRRRAIQRLLGLVYVPLVAVILASGSLLGPGGSAEAADHGALGHAGGASVAAVAAAPTSAIAGPTDLRIVPLDSTLHVTWTPSADPATTWHVASIWDGGALQGTKVVGKTARAAQMNGLMPGHAYMVRVQAMDGGGGLSVPIEGTATTVRQQPMANAAFYEDFNGPGGDLDANYFDVRSSHSEALRPEGLGAERFLVFNSERHFHTQLIGGKQRAELYLRPRVPFDFAGRTGTFQVEVDVAPTQHSEGKWWELHLVRSLPWSAEEFGAGRGDSFPDSLEFSSRVSHDPETQESVNIPQITVNVGGTVRTFVGSAPQLTPTNIRIPVVVRVSETSAELLMNGVSVVRAEGFQLPFTRGYWVLAHRGWYAPRDLRTTPVPLQLVHWETIQYDGPPGSVNPIVRTYLQPGCAGLVRNEHDEVAGCPKLSFSPASPTQTVTLAIPENVAAARSARLLFNGSAPAGFTVWVNGQPMAVPTKTCCFLNALNSVEVPVAWLRQGANTLELRYDGALSALPDLTQVELEVVYNQPRVLAAASMGPMAMIGATSQSFRVDHIPGDPAVQTVTTSLYSQGSANPVGISAHVVTTDTPWLTVVPSTGSLTSPVLGGGMVPLALSIDFGALTTDSDGEVGVIRVDGGAMPVYLAVLAVNDGSGQRPGFLPAFTNLGTTFNPNAIPTPGGDPPPSGTRPQIRVTTARTGPGRLQVTVAAGNGSTPLQAIRFGTARNALIDAGGQVGSPGGFTVTLAPATQQTTFTIRRVVQGQSTTVPLVAIDRYGEWPTFVGGGPTAF